jgi:uncharacterized membrane protein YdjX (TVP38/TMEM64 family)
MSKFWGWLAVFGLMGIVYLLFPEFCREAYIMLTRGDIAALAEYIRSFGAMAVVITILLFVITTFTVVFPFMILSGAAGIVFGLFWGTVISWMGELLGAVAMFFLARYFFREWVAGKIANTPYLKQVDDYSAKNGFKVLLIARLMPLAPSEIITAVASISSISFKHFFWGTFIGKLPPVIIKVLLGHDLVYADENMFRLGFIIFLVVLLYVVVWWRKRKKRQEDKNQENKDRED